MSVLPEMQRYLATARRRQQQRKENLHQRRQHALAQAKVAAHILREEFDVSRIVVFGSVLDESAFHESSDLDLAVWNLSSSDYVDAVARLLRLTDFSIDLVEAERATPYLQASIEKGLDL
ncbi:MAG: nucleotidyltransferase domain-containing protein [Leptolyngbyaceae bacterium]|nr:nucleotidyltransferase domain-containing protein [Leptolyngbyaceae bacterium]